MSLEDDLSQKSAEQIAIKSDVTPETATSPAATEKATRTKQAWHKTTFHALRNRDYRVMWVGSFISNIGTWSQKVAEPWLVFNLSGSAFLLGLNGFAAEVPLLTLLLLGGVLADRFDRKKLLMLSQTIQMLGALTIMTLLLTNRIDVWYIIGVSFVVGCAQSISTPTYLSILPSLVSREYLTNAIALNSTQFNLSRLIGPVIGGALLVGVGAAWCFGINALSYAVLIVVLTMIKVPQVEQRGEQKPVWHSVREGLSLMVSKRELISLIIIIGSVSFFAGPLLNFLPVLAKDVLHVGAKGFSTSLACFGAGAVVGALGIAGFAQGVDKHRVVRWAAILLATAVVGIALSTVYLLTLALLFVAGFAFVGCGSVGNTIIQSSVSDEMRGRAASIYALAFRGGLPLGNLLVGALVHYSNVQVVLASSGSVLLVILVSTHYLDSRKRFSD